MSILQFPSANMILYEKEEIRITVLGGIELYRLDRMRVTLKIEIPNRQHPEYLEHPEIANLALRQSVDLYNQGNEYVKDAGLNWMDFNARAYDPQIGRFLSVDPLASGKGQEVYSPFAAMGNQPESMIDPNGMAYSPSNGVLYSKGDAYWNGINAMYNDPMVNGEHGGYEHYQSYLNVKRVMGEAAQVQSMFDAIRESMLKSCTGRRGTIDVGQPTGNFSPSEDASSNGDPQNSNQQTTASGEKENVSELKDVVPQLQIETMFCGYTVLSMIDKLYGGNRSQYDFKDLYIDPNNKGIQFMNWEYLLDKTGFQYEIYYREGKIDNAGWAIVMREMKKGNASIVLDVNQDGSTHAKFSL